MSQILQPIVLKVACPTHHHEENAISDGRVWYVWSDNEDKKTYSCLPYRCIMGRCQGIFVFDLKEFKYDEVEIHEIDYLEAVEKYSQSVI